MLPKASQPSAVWRPLQVAVVAALDAVTGMPKRVITMDRNTHREIPQIDSDANPLCLQRCGEALRELDVMP